MEKYVVVNKYGIGGSEGDIVYTPRSYGKESHDACERWCKKNDTANTMEIREADNTTPKARTK